MVLVLPKKFSPEFHSAAIKPLQPFEIDPLNPLTLGLRMVIYPTAHNQRDLVTKSQANGGTGTRSSGIVSGETARIYATGSDFFPAPVTLDSVTEYSYLVKATIRNYSSWGFSGFFNKNSDTGNNGSFGNFRSSAEHRIAHGNAAGVSVPNLQSVLATGGEVILMVTWDGATSRTYNFGVQLDSVSHSVTTPTGKGNIKVFSNRDSASSQGDHFVTMVWDRLLSTAEVLSISRNPYQILKPATPPVYFIPDAVVVGNEGAAMYHHLQTMGVY